MEQHLNKLVMLQDEAKVLMEELDRLDANYNPKMMVLKEAYNAKIQEIEEQKILIDTLKRLQNNS
jgi:hypothetical protein